MDGQSTFQKQPNRMTTSTTMPSTCGGDNACISTSVQDLVEMISVCILPSSQEGQASNCIIIIILSALGDSDRLWYAYIDVSTPRTWL